MDAIASAGSGSDDIYRPSFFQLAAQDQLSALLQPALKYVLSVFAQRHPRYLLRIVNRYEEFYAVLMFFIERHYLKEWGSSFAENFYSLKRRRRPGISTDRARAAMMASSSSPAMASKYEKLRPREIYASLVALVGLPYVQAKAQDYYESIGGGVDETELFGDEHEEESASLGEGGSRRTRRWSAEQESLRELVKRRFDSIFRRLYPYVCAAWQAWLLSYNLRYLFNRTPYWRPWLEWMRVDVRMMGEEDFHKHHPMIPPHYLPSLLKHPGLFVLRLLRLSPRIVFETLKHVLPLSIFFFKFLEWWYSAESPRRASGRGGGGAGEGPVTGEEEGVPMFGPPKPLLPSKRGILYRPLRPPPASLLPNADPTLPPGTSLPLPLPPSHTPLPLLHNTCPLCFTSPIANPTVLGTGYAFCYTCAHEFVGREGRCPVTRQRVSLGELRKVLG